MHKPGHLGASLLAYAPLMAVLLAVDQTLTAFAGLAVAGALSMLPDIDQRISAIKHRGASHTVWTPLAVGVAVTLAAHSAIGLAAVFAVGVYTGVNRLIPVLRNSGIVVTIATPLAAGYVFYSLLSSSTAVLPFFEVVIGLAALLSVSAHLAADLITPSGLTPFYPLTDQNYSLNRVKAENTLANFGLLGGGLVVTTVVVLYAHALPL